MPTVVSLAPHKLIEIVDALKPAPEDTEYVLTDENFNFSSVRTERFETSWDAYRATETQYEGESEE
jgi:hypothetical protein